MNERDILHNKTIKRVGVCLVPPNYGRTSKSSQSGCGWCRDARGPYCRSMYIYMKRKHLQYSQINCRMRQILTGMSLWPLVGPPWLGSQTFLVLTPPLLMKDLGTGRSPMCCVSVDHPLFLQESWPCRVAQCMCTTRAQSPYRRCTPPSLNTCRSSSTRHYRGKSNN